MTLENIIYTILIAVISSFVTAKIALKQFSSERWWEQKTKAYIDILESLSFILFFYSSHISILVGTSSINAGELSKKFHEAREVLTKYSVVGSIIISEEASNILNEYLNKSEIEMPNPEIKAEMEYTDEQYTLIKKAIGDFKLVAKKELSSKKLYKPIA
jgi:hypothetical protein